MGWFTKAQETVTFGEIKENSELDRTLKEINRIEDFFKEYDPRIDDIATYTLPYIEGNTPVLETCYRIIKDRARLKQEHAELKAVVDGNGEYYGRFVDNFTRVRNQLENTELHLKLEKEMYQKLYERNRELETELYLLKREVEILKQQDNKDAQV